MNERSELRMQLAATLVSSLLGPVPSSAEAVAAKLPEALGLADKLIELHEAQGKIDPQVTTVAQVAAFTTLGTS